MQMKDHIHDKSCLGMSYPVDVYPSLLWASITPATRTTSIYAQFSFISKVLQLALIHKSQEEINQLV